MYVRISTNRLAKVGEEFDKRIDPVQETTAQCDPNQVIVRVQDPLIETGVTRTEVISDNDNEQEPLMEAEAEKGTEHVKRNINQITIYIHSLITQYN